MLMSLPTDVVFAAYGCVSRKDGCSCTYYGSSGSHWINDPLNASDEDLENCYSTAEVVAPAMSMLQQNSINTPFVHRIAMQWNQNGAIPTARTFILQSLACSRSYSTRPRIPISQLLTSPLSMLHLNPIPALHQTQS
jgi:hypothetical protein